MRQAFTVTAALALAACGGNDSDNVVETEEGAISAAVNGEESTVTWRSADGEEAIVTSATGGSTAASLPDGFTLYPGAEVTSSTNIASNDGGGAIVVMQSPAAPDRLLAHYRAEAEAAGVTIASEANAGGSRVIAGEGPDGLTFSFNATPAGDGTIAQLVVGRGSQ